mmetsp:Transcript_9512/g.29340  ORF Transcript_9512/g.29340 Transcript_9512/m.29340 type:complete len:254 (+) Transcript_9512:2500-3261(+)
MVVRRTLNLKRRRVCTPFTTAWRRTKAFMAEADFSKVARRSACRCLTKSRRAVQRRSANHRRTRDCARTKEDSSVSEYEGRRACSPASVAFSTEETPTPSAEAVAAVAVAGDVALLPLRLELTDFRVLRRLLLDRARGDEGAVEVVVVAAVVVEVSGGERLSCDVSGAESETRAAIGEHLDAAEVVAAPDCFERGRDCCAAVGVVAADDEDDETAFCCASARLTRGEGIACLGAEDEAEDAEGEQISEGCCGD